MTAPERLRQWLAFKTTGEMPDGMSQDDIDAMTDSDEYQDTISECRSGEYATGLPCDYSRHYESKAVAAKMLDGSYVGWTYWYGGGKHGEPSAMEWIDGAYDVVMTEVMEVVRKFSLVPSEAVAG